MKSIRFKILISMTSVILAALLVTGIVSIMRSSESTARTLEQSMLKTVSLAADRVGTELKAYHEVVDQMSRNPIISGVSSATVVVNEEEGGSSRIFDKADKINEFRKAEARHGFTLVDCTDETGFSLERYTYVRESDYFKYCRDEGKTFLTAPSINVITGDMAVTVAAPMKVDNTFRGIVFGVLDAGFLSEVAGQIQIGERGSTFILDNAGTIIASPNVDEVLNRTNAIKLAEADKSFAEKAKIHQVMIQGETGYATYKEDGKNVLLAYAPIPNTNGWSIGLVVDESEFMSATTNSTVFTVLLTIFAVGVACFLAFKLANNIAKPVAASVNRLELLAKGDLKTPVELVNTKDETGTLTRAMAQTVDSLNAIIGDMTQYLGEMSQGNFAAESNLEYLGDFHPIKLALDEINRSLNDVMEHIDQSAEQVASGAEQVAGGSQALSQGATEQASSIQELSASIAEISEEVKRNASNAANASKLSDDAAQKVAQGETQMERLVEAMNEISTTSSTISKIIKSIEDIAFQTNILALNASVEAARAGAAGKGFTVVADEVRNLAAKSAEAAQNTAALIEDSLSAVENGTKLTNETAQALKAIVKGSLEINKLIAEISRASGEQAVSINQITQGVDQISAVVQTNSATAEQAAAASEELSSQAQVLKNLVNKVKLKSRASTEEYTTSQQPQLRPQINSQFDSPSVEYNFATEAISSGSDKY